MLRTEEHSVSNSFGMIFYFFLNHWHDQHSHFSVILHLHKLRRIPVIPLGHWSLYEGIYRCHSSLPRQQREFMNHYD